MRSLIGVVVPFVSGVLFVSTGRRVVWPRKHHLVCGRQGPVGPAPPILPPGAQFARPRGESRREGAPGHRGLKFPANYGRAAALAQHHERIR